MGGDASFVTPSFISVSGDAYACASLPEARRSLHLGMFVSLACRAIRSGHAEVRYRPLRADERAGRRSASPRGERARLGQSGGGNRELGQERAPRDSISVEESARSSLEMEVSAGRAVRQLAGINPRGTRTD